jgi:regulation of enolase protein 1 (concanavalin A-like superfamily)
MKDIVSMAALLRALTAALIVCAMGSTAGAQGLPVPWIAVDIGSPASTGATMHVAGTFTLDAGGNDIAGSSDQFHFLHQAIAGDVDIVARLDGLTATHPWTVAGLMVRASLAANASHAFVAVTPDKGVLFRSRASSGANTSQLTGPALKPPAWLRLVRQGPLVRAFASGDGATWLPLGSATISAGDTIHVGVAAASRHARNRTTAIASNVSVRSIGLPPGQQNMDIGAPALTGDAFAVSGWYSITAAGAGIDGAADQFHLVYQPVTGNVGRGRPRGLNRRRNIGGTRRRDGP